MWDFVGNILRPSCESGALFGGSIGFIYMAKRGLLLPGT